MIAWSTRHAAVPQPCAPMNGPAMKGLRVVATSGLISQGHPQTVNGKVHFSEGSVFARSWLSALGRGRRTACGDWHRSPDAQQGNRSQGRASNGHRAAGSRWMPARSVSPMVQDSTLAASTGWRSIRTWLRVASEASCEERWAVYWRPGARKLSGTASVRLVPRVHGADERTCRSMAFAPHSRSQGLAQAEPAAKAEADTA